MTESKSYLNFFKSYFHIFTFFGLIGLIVAYYLFSQLPTVYVAERMYEFPYTLDNASSVEKESEQAVSILRAPQLKEELGIQKSTISIYKPGPFAISIMVKDLNAEDAVYNMSVLGGYFNQKYQTQEIGNETFSSEPKPLLKYLLLGFSSAEMVGLFLALTLAYLKKY